MDWNWGHVLKWTDCCMQRSVHTCYSYGCVFLCVCYYKWTETRDTYWNELIVACSGLRTLVTVTVVFLCACYCKWTETEDVCWNELIVACSGLCAPCWPTPRAEISTNGSDCKSFWSRSSTPSSSNAQTETGNKTPTWPRLPGWLLSPADERR